jgi:hypothetical protein
MNLHSDKICLFKNLIPYIINILNIIFNFQKNKLILFFIINVI